MADVELLPCPFCGAKLHEYEHSFVHPHPSSAHGFCLIAGLSFRRDQLDFWSRRATAAKDAEIEALRAEVRDLRKRQAGWERHVAAAGCEYVRDGEHDALVNRRAARLEEALQELSQCDGSPVNVANAEVLAARVRSIANRALAQEDRND